MNRFEKVYNALLDAYLNGTLASGSCYACAVGNIVAAAQGGVITSINDPFVGFTCTTHNTFWTELFCTPFGVQMKNFVNQTKMTLLENLTGYSVEEMAQVEYLFESNTKLNERQYHEFSEKEIRQDQYNGLKAVLDYLSTLDHDTPEKYMEPFETHKDAVLC